MSERRSEADVTPIIACETDDGCTCGAPASTPAGMHHCDCAVHPGWCGRASCLPCQWNGQVTPPAQPDGEASACPTCRAGMESSEHHEMCVAPLDQIEGDV